MEQSYKKQPPRATAFCMTVLLDMGKFILDFSRFDLTD